MTSVVGMIQTYHTDQSAACDRVSEEDQCQRSSNGMEAGKYIFLTGWMCYLDHLVFTVTTRYSIGFREQNERNLKHSLGTVLRQFYSSQECVCVYRKSMIFLLETYPLVYILSSHLAIRQRLTTPLAICYHNNLTKNLTTTRPLIREDYRLFV